MHKHDIIAIDNKYEVVLVARNEDKAKNVLNKIKADTGHQNVSYRIVDLSNKEEIFQFASEWDKPLHILVNNAAITPRLRQENKEGIELQFATNVLGYFWMIQAFKERLFQSAPSRIVNVASYWAGGLDLDDELLEQGVNLLQDEVRRAAVGDLDSDDLEKTGGHRERGH